MKLLIFSDLHLAPWSLGSQRLPDGTTSRMMGQLQVLRDIRQFVIDHNIMHTVFGGDFFHTFNQVDGRVLYHAHKALQSWPGWLHFNVGNHDMTDKEGRSNTVQWIESEDGSARTVGRGVDNLVLIPYTEKRDVLLRKLEAAPTGAVVIVHQGVFGVPVGNDFVLPDEVLRPEDVPDHVAHVFAGHYHGHSRVTEKLTVIGATMQHTRGDAGQRRGWLTYDTETGVISQFESKAPKFVRLGVDKDPVEGNFVLASTTDSDVVQDMMNALSAQGAATVEVEYIKETAPITAAPQDLSVPAIFESFITSVRDPDRVSIGRTILRSKCEPAS